MGGKYVPNPDGPKTGTAQQRFWKRFVVDESGCWIFGDANNDPDEYGHIRYEGKQWQAHRFSYLLHHGELPEGLVIDHMCHNKRCVNPEHLQAVTHKQNLENFSNPTGWGTSGVRGVYRTKRGSWAAEARDGDSRHRKTLKTKREAVEWVRETRLKFHTNNLLDRA